MKYLKGLTLTTLFILLLATAVLNSCGTAGNAASDESGLGDFQMEKSGAVLWGENCGRCHNAPDPTAFSDVQWEAIGTHMRIRAGLTAEDTERIIQFLQQSN